MPISNSEYTEGARHSDDIQDIITAVPSWVMRWGITVCFAVMILLFGLSTLINYPDVVKTSVKIVAANSAKPVVAKTTGNVFKLLVADNSIVNYGQPLAYLEATARHEVILQLLDQLQAAQGGMYRDPKMVDSIKLPDNLPDLGELQISYQNFYQTYVSYRSANDNGYYQKRKNYLQNDLSALKQQQAQLHLQKEVLQKEYVLAGQEFEMHKKLTDGQVESKAEFRNAQSVYLSKRSPLLQTEGALITAGTNYAAKKKEILELDDQVIRQKVAFMQALNSLISQVLDWKNKYVLSAPQNGKLNFAGLIQENQQISAGQDVFYINPDNGAFFGEMTIPQDNMGKIRVGQKVLIKLKSYPFEQYGMIRGQITNITDVPLRDSVFLSRVDLNSQDHTDLKKAMILKQGMSGTAEIITQNATVFQRMVWSLTKLVNHR